MFASLNAVATWFRRLPLRMRLPLLASLSCLLLLSDDAIQQWFTPANQAELEMRYVLVLWCFSAGLWLCGSRVLVVVVLCVLALMQVIQLGQISFFGEPLTPADLGSLFGQFGEVYETGMYHLDDHWPVVLAVGIPYVALITLHWRVRLPVIPRARLAGLLMVCLVLAAKPYRATYRDMSAFMPGPTRSSLHNSLNAFSYFAVRMLSQADAHLPDAGVAPYRIEPRSSGAKHVWVIVADSLRTDRLGAMGYHRDTTPHLSRMLAQGALLARPGIAAGVSTAVSLPLFINLLREPGQHALLREQPYNLFRLAREAGFRTHWLSSQESKVLSFLGSRFIDVSITREDHPLRFNSRHDHALVDLLGEQAWHERNFVVINLRTAHSPYEKNYLASREVQQAWPTSNTLPREEKKSNAYDNAILYLDDVLAEIISQSEQLEGERYLLFTGDHGQLLGDGGRWGHNDLVPEVASVPVMAMARGAPADALQALAEDRWVSHHEAGLWLARHLGFDVHNPNAVPGEHFLQGKQLMGDNYIQRVREQEAGLIFDHPVLLSRWLEKRASTASSTPEAAPVTP